MQLGDANLCAGIQVMSRDIVDSAESRRALEQTPARDWLPERAEQQAREALAKSPLMALRQLAIERAENRLHISGHVATFYQKQQAQELVRAHAHGLAVVNDVQVS